MKAHLQKIINNEKDKEGGKQKVNPVLEKMKSLNENPKAGMKESISLNETTKMGIKENRVHFKK